LATAAYVKGGLRTTELRRSWEHTLATAVLADQIARACGVFTDVAYTAGIIHDIGRLGLLVAYPREYERIIRDAADRCLDLLDFESLQFGVHHAEAGRILAERWGLPDEFRIVAGRHHDPCEGRELDLLRIVHVACRLADALGYDFTCPLIPSDVEAILASLPDVARERCHMPADELRAAVEQRIRAYDGPDDDRQVEASGPEETQPAPDEPRELAPDRGVTVTRRAAWIAAAVALITVSAILLLR
jgi:putative nucleotidyltransferase with HDIG domain